MNLNKRRTMMSGVYTLKNKGYKRCMNEPI